MAAEILTPVFTYNSADAFERAFGDAVFEWIYTAHNGIPVISRTGEILKVEGTDKIVYHMKYKMGICQPEVLTNPDILQIFLRGKKGIKQAAEIKNILSLL
jgi:hypothetical protein